MIARLRWLLPFLATLSAAYHAYGQGFLGQDPGRAWGSGIRGGDLVSFWAGGTLIARGDRENLYTLKRSRPVVRELFPKKPPIYPVGYPPPIYELFAWPQPSVSYFDTVRVLLVAMAVCQVAVAAVVVRTTPALSRWQPEALAALIAFPGFYSTMWAGQLGPLWTLMLMGGLALPGLAGGVVTGLLWIKPTLAVPAITALLLVGEWRRAAGNILGGALVLALSLVSGGLPDWIGFLHYLQDPGHIVVAYLGHWDREMTLRALLVYPIRKAELADTFGWIAVSAGWILTLASAWLARRCADRELGVAAVFGASFYTAAHLLDYDQGLLLPALIPSAIHAIRNRSWLGIAAVALGWLFPTLIPFTKRVGFHLPALAMALWLSWLIGQVALRRR